MSDDCTIYIVDDDACVRRALSRLLASSGYGVVTCESAEALLALPSLARPSCLLVDIRMPGSTGLELQHALRASANPPIVMLSGHADATIAERAVACGAVAVLLKPVDESLLLSALESTGAGTSQCSATFPPRSTKRPAVAVTFAQGGLRLLGVDGRLAANAKLLHPSAQSTGLQPEGGGRASSAFDAPSFVVQHPQDVCALDIHEHRRRGRGDGVQRVRDERFEQA